MCDCNEVIVLPPTVQRIGLEGKKCSFVRETAALGGSAGSEAAEATFVPGGSAGLSDP